MLKAILFDMDGVLIDSEIEYRAQDIRLGRELGIELTDEYLENYVGVSTAETWAGIVKDFDLKQDPRDLEELETKRMSEHYKSGDLHVIAESVEIVKKCEDYGLKAAVATSTIIENAEIVTERLGLIPYVGAIATSCKAGASKPEPDIFLLAAKMLEVKPDECLVIEDSYNGLVAAKRAGMAAVVLAPEGVMFDASAADMVVSSCCELSLEILKEIHENSLNGE